MVVDNAEEILKSAIVAQSSGNIDGASALYERLISNAPERPEGYVNLGRIKQDQGDLNAAEGLYRQAIAVVPDAAVAHLNLGVIHVLRGDDVSAAAAFKHALKLDPAFASAHFNLAGVYQREGHVQSALSQLDALLADYPNDLSAILAKVPMLFDLGRLEEAWTHYAHRGGIFPDTNSSLSAPLWHGENISNKKILLSYEQGLGEQIMFASMVPEIIAQDVDLTIECEPRLVPLFTRSFPGVAVVPWQKPRHHFITETSFDMFAPMGNAGKWLRRTFDMFPQHHGYLSVDPKHVSAFREKYSRAAKGKSLVGLSWCSTAEKFGPDKSIPPAMLAPMLDHSDVFWINLQHGAAADDIVHDSLLRDPDIDPLIDMDGFAAQIAALDLVVSVSNTTAHVAGALGLPVYIMLPKVKNRHWYWFPDRTINPWYPSLQTFVQSTDGDWSDVIAAMTDTIAKV